MSNENQLNGQFYEQINSKVSTQSSADDERRIAAGYE